MWEALNTTWNAHPYIQVFLVNFLSACAILIVGWTVSGILGKTIRRIAQRSAYIDPTIVPMLQVAAVWALRIFVIISVLARFGVQTASLIAALGAAGLAIGLALQGTLQNIAAGIMLLALRPLRIGEYVSIVGRAEGTVEEVGLFLTRVRQADGILVHMPNNLIWGNTIVNYSRNAVRRIDIAIQVPHSFDLDEVLDVLREMTVQHSQVMDQPATVVMVTADLETYSTVSIQAWAKVEHFSALRVDLYRRARAALRALRENTPLEGEVLIGRILRSPDLPRRGATD